MDTEYQEDWRGNPILTSSHLSGPAPKRRPSAALSRIILELGLRYRPPSSARLDEHNAKVAALIADLIDVPVGPLEKACGQWVARSPYMPKASDLIDLAQQAVAPPPAAQSAQAWCDMGNATMDRYSKPIPSEQIEWFVDSRGGEATPRLRWKASAQDGPPYCTPSEAREILRNHPSGFAKIMLAAIESRAA